MRRRIRRSGFTLIELLVVGIITTLIGVGLWTLLRSAYDSQYGLMNQNNANMDSRMAADDMADAMRGMASLTAATATDVTFTDNSGNTVRWWWNSADKTLRTTTNSLPSGGTVKVQNESGLALTYWSWNGSAWASSSTPSPVSSVGAIDILVTASINGSLRQTFSSVKLRQIRLNNANGF